jgi:hypothetical protein
MSAAKDGKMMEGMTERQKKWFASVHASFERDTGKPLAEWVEIVKTCPHQTPRARADWLREVHGLKANRIAQVLDAAYPSGAGWDEPEVLRAQLWKDPAALAILQAIEAKARDLPQPLVSGQRKGYTSFSRDVQFAATRPLKGGRALLGLKLEPAVSDRLSPSVRKESWSERLSAVVELDAPEQVDREIARLLRAAWERG